MLRTLALLARLAAAAQVSFDPSPGSATSSTLNTTESSGATASTISASTSSDARASAVPLPSSDATGTAPWAGVVGVTVDTAPDMTAAVDTKITATQSLLSKSSHCNGTTHTTLPHYDNATIATTTTSKMSLSTGSSGGSDVDSGFITVVTTDRYGHATTEILPAGATVSGVSVGMNDSVCSTAVVTVTVTAPVESVSSVVTVVSTNTTNTNQAGQVVVSSPGCSAGQESGRCPSTASPFTVATIDTPGKTGDAAGESGAKTSLATIQASSSSSSLSISNSTATSNTAGVATQATTEAGDSARLSSTERSEAYGSSSSSSSGGGPTKAVITLTSTVTLSTSTHRSTTAGSDAVNNQAGLGMGVVGLLAIALL